MPVEMLPAVEAELVSPVRQCPYLQICQVSCVRQGLITVLYCQSISETSRKQPARMLAAVTCCAFQLVKHVVRIMQCSTHYDNSTRFPHGPKFV